MDYCFGNHFGVNSLDHQCFQKISQSTTGLSKPHDQRYNTSSSNIQILPKVLVSVETNCGAVELQSGACAMCNKIKCFCMSVYLRLSALGTEWATDDVLYYTSQEGLRCRHVFRLHLTNTGFHSMLVYEEKDPE